MNSVDLSVILCTHNRASTLTAVLDDFRSQDFRAKPLKWELVLVDNNSTDNTKDVVQDYRKNSDLPIKYVFEPQQGKSFALNTGLTSSGGHLLAFTDDDVVLDSHWLSTLREAFDTYPHKCFGGRVLPLFEGPLPHWLTDRKPYALVGGPLVKEDCGDEVKLYDETMYVPMGCNMFVRRELFDKYGGFDTRLGFYSKEALIYGEDTELMFRFKNSGEAILYFPRALVYHPVPMARLKKSYFKKWFWGTGRGMARWHSVPDGAVRYRNIPRYIIRETFRDILQLFLALTSPRESKRFFYEAKLLYKLGMVYEYYQDGD